MAQTFRPYPKADKKEVENYYNTTASSYDSLHAQEQQAKYAEALRKLEGGKLKGVILDAGCGTGLLFNQLKGFENLISVDLSGGMLNIAKRRAEGKANVHLIRCDVERLPFRGMVFDACFFFTVAQNLPNPLEAFKELGRVSRREAAMALTLMDGTAEVGDVLKLTGLKLALESRVGRETVLVGFKVS
jgi:ubiquinone/menaquinone biosynthesis C-methylase UbiE